MERPHEVPVFPVSVQIPLMTRERFAGLTGLDEGVLRGMINKGYLPTLKLGRHRLINLVALSKQCEEEWEV